MFFTSHLKRYINRYGKATFFVFEASHINTLRVTSLAGNSYPYYQDKKKLVSLVSKTLLIFREKFSYFIVFNKIICHLSLFIKIKYIIFI
ncbi:protein cop [Staphylococcus saprophyticus]|nr:protein cop [Staphylococcus saprophyticus]